jgi:hypothetical protein
MILKAIQFKSPSAQTLWGLAIAYMLISPMALLIPIDVFARYPWTRDFTDAVSQIVPMIERVVVYGHPHPDQLRCFLAYVWCCIPLVGVVFYRSQESNNKPQAWGPGISDFWVKWFCVLLFAFLIFFFLWYVPNLPFFGMKLLDPISIPYDGRKKLFWSTTSLFVYTPLWACAFAWALDLLRCELLNALWRVGVVSSYPSRNFSSSSERNNHD